MARQKSSTPTRHQKAREKTKQETYDALVNAATRLFGTQGLDVSLDEVCAEAGYTRGAFYVHFKDRDELTLAVMERVGEKALNHLLEPSGSEGNFSVLVSSFMVSLASGKYPLSKAGGIRPYQLLDACARSGVVRKKYISLCQRAADRLAERIRRAQTDGQLRPDVPAEQLAFLLLVIVIGIHTLYDLEYPLNLGTNAASLGRLLAPKRD